MFREMRRFKEVLPAEETAAILERGASGVLAVAGDDDYPYAVPMSYVFDKEGAKLYFHCARSGHKLDAIRRNPKASFAVVDMDHIVPEEYTTYFRSAIVFGRIRIMEDDGEKLAALIKLAKKYAPDDAPANMHRAIDREWDQVCLLEMAVEHMSGKEAIELVRARAQEHCASEK